MVRARAVTLLMIASALGALDAVRWALGQGADPNSMVSNGVTALHLASKFGRVQVACALLQGGADANFEAACRGGGRAVDIATRHLTVHYARAVPLRRQWASVRLSSVLVGVASRQKLGWACCAHGRLAPCGALLDLPWPIFELVGRWATVRHPASNPFYCAFKILSTGTTFGSIFHNFRIICAKRTHCLTRFSPKNEI